MVAKLIINADDYGLAEPVSRGILRAAKSGIVSSTSVLINLVTQADIELLRASGLPAGVHLSLTVGQSTLPPDEIPDLVDEKGFFYKRKTPMRPMNENGFVNFDSAPYNQILSECYAQVCKFLDYGLSPTHLDTHHHTHADSKVMDAVSEVALTHRLPVRNINRSMRDLLRSRDIPTNDRFEGRFFGTANINLQNFSTILADTENGVTELMCHPGEYSLELENISGYTKERAMELAILESRELKSLIQNSHIEIISWHSVLL